MWLYRLTGNVPHDAGFCCIANKVISTHAQDICRAMRHFPVLATLEHVMSLLCCEMSHAPSWKRQVKRHRKAHFTWADSAQPVALTGSVANAFVTAQAT